MSWYRRLSRNARTGVIMFALVFGMVGVAYASVPLYRMFCQLTGFAGTPQIEKGGRAPGAVAGRTISIRFDGNTDPQKETPKRGCDSARERPSTAAPAVSGGSARATSGWAASAASKRAARTAPRPTPESPARTTWGQAGCAAIEASSGG